MVRGWALLAAALGVCSAQIFPAPPEMAAKVITLTGQVSVLHDTEPWALKTGDSVQVMQVILTGPDGYALFQVSDGSTFEVFPNSNVVFRKNPPNWRDLLDVLVGRVKIHIQRWGGQPNPNRVHTPSAVISVRGTTFDVSVDGDSETTFIRVEEGQVDVRHATRGGETKTINAGETLEVYKSQPLAVHVIDKAAVAQRVMHGISDALYTVLTNPRTGGLGSVGPKLPGQKPPPTPPPFPPPPPPPPPH
jgi:hypothetical protein